MLLRSSSADGPHLSKRLTLETHSAPRKSLNTTRIGKELDEFIPVDNSAVSDELDKFLEEDDPEKRKELFDKYKMLPQSKRGGKKRKSKNKIVKPKNKTCKKFCKEVFLPERERVEIEFSKKYRKLKYKPIKLLRKTNKNSSVANLLENAFLKDCDDIYCQKDCKGSKNKWLKSFTKKRKENLIQQGAISGCRDLIKEFPEDYKNI